MRKAILNVGYLMIAVLAIVFVSGHFDSNKTLNREFIQDDSNVVVSSGSCPLADSNQNVRTGSCGGTCAGNCPNTECAAKRGASCDCGRAI